jgi:hypothetical protein
MTTGVADPTRTASPGVVELVAEVVRRAASAPLSPDDPVASIAALLALDPRNTSHFQANITVIVCDALADPQRETHANRWRPVRPAWVRPSTVGAAVNRLAALRVLRPTGRYVRNTDAKGRNRNKLLPVYTLNLTALAAIPTPRAAIHSV